MSTDYIVTGIDPGSSQLGIASIYFEKGVAKKIYTDNISYKTYALRDVFSDVRLADLTLHQRIEYINGGIAEHILMHSPHVMGVETPYLDKYVNAFAALSNQKVAINKMLAERKPGIFVDNIAPTEGKAAINAKYRRGVDSKVIVFNAISTHPILSPLCNYEELTEHEIDAIVVAYAVERKLHK